MMPNCPSCNRTISPGTTLCRSCGAPIPESATTTADLEREVSSLLDQGRKIEAVKIYKERTGSSLKEAKYAVEALQRRANPPSRTGADAALEADVLRLLGQGEKIKAVKLYRDRTGSTLFDSKREVEEIAARHGIIVEQAGCGSGVVVVLVVVLIAIAVVAALTILR